MHLTMTNLLLLKDCELKNSTVQCKLQKLLIIFQIPNTNSVHSFVVSGKYNLKMSLDDEIDIKVEAFNFQGGQYKKMVEKQLNQFCTTLYIDAFKEAHSVFYEASSLQVPFYTCPFPAGENEITNLMIDEKGMLPPYIPGGEKWRIDVRFLKNAEVLGGYNVYGLIRSDESLLKGG